MLGPMVNPAFVKKQLVGVFNLELARLYGYLYQQTDKQYVILHSLDGYDEISLTGAFKSISNSGEKIISPEQLGFTTLSQADLNGGESIEDSARIFLNILKGEGTEAQNSAVIANAGFAIQAANSKDTLVGSIERARESLNSGKAFNSFRNFLDKEIKISLS